MASATKGELARRGDGLETLVLAEQVRGLYARARVAFLTVVVNSAIVAYVLWSTGSHDAIEAWLAAIYAVTIARTVLHVQYTRLAPAPREARAWGRAFALGSAANGVAWGAGGYFLYAPGELSSQMLLVFVLGGMCAGAASSTATYSPAFVGFALPALAPVIGRLFSGGDTLHWSMGAMLTLFGLAMTTIARTAGRHLIDSARLRFQNEELAHDLAEARTGLEDKVRARTAEVEAQSELLQKVFDHSPVMLQIWDEHGKIKRLNREAEERLEWSLEDYATPEAFAAVFPDEGDGAPSGTWHDYVSRTKSGERRHTTWAVVRLAGGTTIRLGQDVTLRKRTQDALAFSERMASVGTLAAGVAHEINNPLAFLLANQSFLRERLQALIEELGADKRTSAHVQTQLGEALDALTDAQTGADRVRNIVGDMKTLSRAGDDVKRPIDIAPILEASLRMAKNELRHRAHVETDFGPTPAVLANEARLGQVFLNLLVNAAQAIPEGAAAQHTVRVVTRTDDDGRAVVEIHDSGSGIAADVLPRIFDPFFTTKQLGQGMGLGLSIVHGIVQQLGGSIDVESEVGRGTVFRVVLPSTAESPVARASAAPGARASGRLRVLVIDDEPLATVATKRVLGADYHVDVEVSGEAALGRLAAGAGYDVILCDLMMPDVTGMDFLERLAARDPKQASRVVLLTAGAFTERARAFLDRVQNPRLEKPCDKERLDEVIRAVALLAP